MMRWVQASTISQPPPTQGPPIAATVGIGRSSKIVCALALGCQLSPLGRVRDALNERDVGANAE